MTTTRAPAPAPAAAVDVRRHIRRMRVAAVGRVDPSSVYCVLLAIVMAAALFGQPLGVIVWPADAAGPSVPALVGAGLVLLAFLGVLRRLGPVVVTRADATWLLPAPVPRRTLLTPALLLTALSATVVGGLVGLAVAGRVAERPATSTVVVAGVAGGAAVGLLLALLAVHAQTRPRNGRVVDLAAGTVAAALVAVAVGEQLTGGYAPPRDVLPSASTMLVVVAAVAFPLALAAVAGVWWRLNSWPTHRIAEASASTGSYADALYAVEPSFLAAQSSRRYWRNRTGIRTSRLLRDRRVPPLTAQDLLQVRRNPGRLPWLVGTALAPAVVADGPVWLLIGVVLVGALAAASVTAEATHTDASNPAALRLLGLTFRQVYAQRLVVPTGVAALWGALALGTVQATGLLSGPWWALGLAAGPAAAVAALYRAKISASSVGNIFIDTPLGAFPSGLLLWLVNGLDVVAVLALPMVIALVTARAPEQLSWSSVLVQAALSVAGCLVLLLRRSSARTVGV
ncbi:hypothetical protein E1211_07365 [Micromonospora sp. 15K316]|uniref:DUF6297 family protein n=1 Tax=Micromonospora sp. 15K316 TaxID=2530376 RepID=UPI00104BDF04|nr:DUF6297 family protein [Micromonospora sp. 15K316]TDC38375.1 hypothetical protein E1211_07365 [Micromonospora sp. 15K316]